MEMSQDSSHTSIDEGVEANLSPAITATPPKTLITNSRQFTPTHSNLSNRIDIASSSQVDHDSCPYFAALKIVRRDLSVKENIPIHEMKGMLPDNVLWSISQSRPTSIKQLGKAEGMNIHDPYCKQFGKYMTDAIRKVAREESSNKLASNTEHVAKRRRILSSNIQHDYQTNGDDPVHLSNDTILHFLRPYVPSSSCAWNNEDTNTKANYYTRDLANNFNYKKENMEPAVHHCKFASNLPTALGSNISLSNIKGRDTDTVASNGVFSFDQVKLGRQYRFEDMLQCQPGSVIVVQVPMRINSGKHKCSHGPEWNQCWSKLADKLRNEPVDGEITYTFGYRKVLYNYFYGTIKSNSFLNDLNTLTSTNIKLRYECGDGIEVSLPSNLVVPVSIADINSHHKDNCPPIRLWGPLAHKPPSWHKILQDFTDLNRVNTFVDMMWKEVRGCGNESEANALLFALYRTTSRSQSKKKSPEKLLESSLDFKSNQLKVFLKDQNKVYKDALSDASKNFKKYGLPLIPRDTINDLVICFYKSFPQIFNLLYLQNVHHRSSTYTSVEKHNKGRFSQKSIVIKSSDRMLLFSFNASCRRRYPRLMKHWALIMNFAHFSKGIMSSKQAELRMLGWCLADSKFRAYMRNQYKKLISNNCEAIKEEEMSIFILDNDHENRKLKNQVGGHCSQGSISTSRYVVKPYDIDNSLLTLLKKTKNVTQLSHEIIIPSPPIFPKYETLDDNSIHDVCQVICNPSYLQNSSESDTTGLRTSKYMKISRLCDGLVTMKKILLSSSKDSSIDIIPSLASNEDYMKVRGEIFEKARLQRYGILLDAKQFQEKNCLIWNNSYGKLSRCIIQELSQLDDMKTIEIGSINIYQGFVSGIFKFGDASKGELPIVLTDNWDKHWILTTGDCTTVVNIRGFIAKLSNIKYNNFRSYALAQVLRKGLSRFFTSSGEWHVRYNMIETIMALFYGGIIQGCQLCLNWKHVRPDISNCVQTVVSLLYLILSVYERFMFDVFIHMLDHNKWKKLLKLEEKEFCVRMLSEFESYLESKSSSKKSTLASSFGQFWRMTKDLRLYHNSTNIGDPIPCEHIFCEWTPAYLQMKRRKYFQLTLKEREGRYGSWPPFLLHVDRCNKFFLLHGKGSNRLAEEATHQTRDGFNEEINRREKALPRSKSFKYRQQNSAFLGLGWQCHNFVSEQYGDLAKVLDKNDASPTQIKSDNISLDGITIKNNIANSTDEYDTSINNYVGKNDDNMSNSNSSISSSTDTDSDFSIESDNEFINRSESLSRENEDSSISADDEDESENGRSISEESSAPEPAVGNPSLFEKIYDKQDESLCFRRKCKSMKPSRVLEHKRLYELFYLIGLHEAEEKGIDLTEKTFIEAIPRVSSPLCESKSSPSKNLTSESSEQNILDEMKKLFDSSKVAEDDVTEALNEAEEYLASEQRTLHNIQSIDKEGTVSDTFNDMIINNDNDEEDTEKEGKISSLLENESDAANTKNVIQITVDEKGSKRTIKYSLKDVNKNCLVDVFSEGKKKLRKLNLDEFNKKQNIRSMVEDKVEQWLCMDYFQTHKKTEAPELGFQYATKQVRAAQWRKNIRDHRKSFISKKK